MPRRDSHLPHPAGHTADAGQDTTGLLNLCTLLACVLFFFSKAFTSFPFLLFALTAKDRPSLFQQPCASPDISILPVMLFLLLQAKASTDQDVSLLP